MAGGVFSSMNKVRPGAYINFEAEPTYDVNLSSRGIATMAMPLSWGSEGKLIEVTANDMLDGNSLAKIGLMINEDDALLLNLALQNCKSVKVYNTNKGGTAAKVTLEGGLTVTARHPGTFGNKIAILIKAVGDRFNVETYANGYYVDSQRVSSISQLQANDFVSFSGTGSLGETVSTLLTGGVDGTAAQSSVYLPEYFRALRATNWNTMAVVSTDVEDKQSVVSFIKQMREEEGKYVQAVVSDYAAADYEGIINNINGIILNDNKTIEANDFTAWVAGAIAGADITESLTGKIVEGATGIIGLLDNDGIIQALGQGKFLLSLNQNGNIRVEKDINSLHTFTPDKGYTFSKNRVIRELDEIGASIEIIWETTYLGKVSNNDAGRTLFKSSIIDYLSTLQNKGAIQDFDSANVFVEQGNDIDSVVASIAIKPVDSMEFLYMTVNVDQ